MCESRYISASPSQNLALTMPTVNAAYYSHRILFLTGLCTLSLTLLGCLGCLCCSCCRRSRRKAASLDAYAPRTQSIVWPALPAETARVVEVTFLHTPGAVDCLCRGCCQTRNVICLEDCLNATEYDYWQTESQSVEEDDNATTNSSGYRIISDINDKNSIYIPVDPLTRVAFVALLLHVLIVGGGIIIYSVVYCKSRTDKKRLTEMRRRLQSPPTLQHLPNSQNCPCHGCRVARQILSGLIVQQIITERSEC
ncbi:uncharacterized protein Dvir_GJ21484 [Drosophila virilis]|uniref:Uncharacterized protein n=1 Tax=Drosophila virilis TaxID=7244 RepID=B4LIZ3_DROVI|nr:uncharacterized protein Dvir_GJ21484 [Drosophila virilis]